MAIHTSVYDVILPSGPVTVALVIKHGLNSSPVLRETWQSNCLILNSELVPHTRLLANSSSGRKSVHFENVYSYTKVVQVVVTINGSENCMYRNGVKFQSDPIADTK